MGSKLGAVQGRKVAVNRLAVLLVGPIARVRQGVRMRIELEPDIEVVGEVGDSDTGPDTVRTLCPDVVVVNLVSDSVGALVSLRRLTATAPVVVLSNHDGIGPRAAIMAAGASALVPMVSSPEELLDAIRRAAREATAGRVGPWCPDVG